MEEEQSKIDTGSNLSAEENPSNTPEPHKSNESIKTKEEKPKEKFSKRIINFYDKQYKKLTLATILLLVVSLILIGVQVAKTGSFINKDVSLKGGVTLTLTKDLQIDTVKLEKSLESQFQKNDISVRSIKSGGKQSGVVIVADIDGTKKEELDSFISSVKSGIGYPLEEKDYSVEIMGSSLGASFFRETITAILIAFILMSIVVFIYFKETIPSTIVVFCCFADIIETLAVVNLLGMKVSTGGIAAFLMLIGYSVDTDMLLTTRVLKRKEGTLLERILSSVNTGMMMTLTSIVALLVGMIFMKSEAVRQIMLIILIGLVFDILNTWIQNVGILRYYLERKELKLKSKNG